MGAPELRYLGPERRRIQSNAERERRGKEHPYGVDASLIAVKRIASIDCLLRRQPGAIVEVPRGIQIQVTYGGPNDKPNAVKVTTPLGDHTGAVTSGSDWVLVRSDGVVMVDARVTLKFAPKVLMDMTLKGTIDLKETFGAPSGQDAYDRYKAGTFDPVLKDGNRFYHRFVGSARFEGGDGAVDSDYADHFKAAPFAISRASTFWCVNSSTRRPRSSSRRYPTTIRPE